MSDLPDVSRRQFVVLAATCAAACACGDAMGAPTSRPSEKIDIGTLADYPKDGIDGKFIRSKQLIVYRESGQIYASTSVCPHRGAPLQIKGDGIWCSKHGSEFSAAGTVTKGPASRSLERFAISTNDSGHLIVDTGTSFTEKKWDDAASFVKVS